MSYSYARRFRGGQDEKDLSDAAPEPANARAYLRNPGDLRDDRAAVGAVLDEFPDAVDERREQNLAQNAAAEQSAPSQFGALASDTADWLELLQQAYMSGQNSLRTDLDEAEQRILELQRDANITPGGPGAPSRVDLQWLLRKMDWAPANADPSGSQRRAFLGYTSIMVNALRNLARYFDPAANQNDQQRAEWQAFLQRLNGLPAPASGITRRQLLTQIIDAFGVLTHGPSSMQQVLDVATLRGPREKETDYLRRLTAQRERVQAMLDEFTTNEQTRRLVASDAAQERLRAIRDRQNKRFEAETRVARERKLLMEDLVMRLPQLASILFGANGASSGSYTPSYGITSLEEQNPSSFTPPPSPSPQIASEASVVPETPPFTSSAEEQSGTSHVAELIDQFENKGASRSPPSGTNTTAATSPTASSPAAAVTTESTASPSIMERVRNGLGYIIAGYEAHSSLTERRTRRTRRTKSSRVKDSDFY